MEVWPGDVRGPLGGVGGMPQKSIRRQLGRWSTGRRRVLHQQLANRGGHDLAGHGAPLVHAGARTKSGG